MVTADLNKAAYCKIFPAIGIARLGNSPDEYFIGPEAPGAVSVPVGGYKDLNGRMKKQAARFRIYAFDEEGNNIGEVTADAGSITWTVQVANRKADWWPFAGTRNVQHIIESGRPRPPLAQQKRNSKIPKQDRSGLSITPDATSISGKLQTGPFMEGRFLSYKKKISLGQCRTDKYGRLLFLGGNGVSDTVLGKDATFLVSYANNDWWFDDTSDGPVAAKVEHNGQEIEVRGSAWVLVAPPDYSPFTNNVVSAYDTVLNKCLELNLDWPENEIGKKPPAQVSFLNDIYPILKRTSDYRWVSERASKAHGRDRDADRKSPSTDYTAHATLLSLADKALAAQIRSPQKMIFKKIRNPSSDDPFEAANQANMSFMPALSGDEGSSRAGDPDRWLTLTSRQYEALQKWSNGDFVDDFPRTEKELSDFLEQAKELESLPLSDQPMALTRAALDACEGGAFFPGIELTSVVRHPSFYSEAFRISNDWNAGDITKWMALPWQADFNDCNDNWWPAVRPDDVISESDFDAIAAQIDGSVPAYRMLRKRVKWSRGLGVRYGGFEFDWYPSLPEPLQDMSTADYKAYAESTLRRFGEFYSWALPLFRTGELEANYLRRVRDFVSQTIGAEELDIEGSSQGLVIELVSNFVQQYLQLGPADTDLDSYVVRERIRINNDPVLTGVFEIAWQVQNEFADKNEMVEAWSELGVVTKQDLSSGETVYVEKGRHKYTRLPWREYFYILMNIEHFPDFMPKAKEFAEEYLQQAREIMGDPSRVGPLHTFFEFSQQMFDARLAGIYEENRQRASAQDPVTNPIAFFNTEEKIVERIRQLGPFNQLDGGWLQRVTAAGNATQVQALLFQIWMDELGNGDPAQNHANIYTDLMRSAGIYYPSIKSKEYAENPEIWDDMFSGPVYHTAISLFPESYYPELIGMTLYLEWEANDLQRMVDLYDYFGYSSLFYKLHVAIDNTVDGHGAAAKKVVELYLDEVREESGEQGVREHWKRIWTGYIAFRHGGIQRWPFHLNTPKTPEERVIDIIDLKREYGSLNHHDKRLGPARINALFDEPRMFVEELQNSNYIVPGDPEASKFMKLTEPDGVMFRVFTEDELDIWRDWIKSLPAPSDGSRLSSALAMVELLRRMAAKGAGSPAHGREKLVGPNPSRPSDKWNETEFERDVAWWFQIVRHGPLDPTFDQNHNVVAFMHALKDPRNGWVVATRPEDSRLVTELLSEGTMAVSLRETRPLLGGVRGSEIIVRWIRDGCPDPEPAKQTLIQNRELRMAAAPQPGTKDPERMERLADRLEAMLNVRSAQSQGRATRPQRVSLERPRGPAMGSVQ